MNIVALTHPARSPIIAPYLKGIEHTLYVSADVKPCPIDRPYDYLNKNVIGAYRCLFNHQMILIHARENTLVFEDDARPRLPQEQWLSIAASAEKLLGEYDVVSLHARHAVYDKQFEHEGRLYATLAHAKHPTFQGKGFEGYWAQGSLAYLITPAAADQFAKICWDGTPVDLLLCNRFKFCCIMDSPFIHEFSQPSILENAVYKPELYEGKPCKIEIPF